MRRRARDASDQTWRGTSTSTSPSSAFASFPAFVGGGRVRGWGLRVSCAICRGRVEGGQSGPGGRAAAATITPVNVGPAALRARVGGFVVGGERVFHVFVAVVIVVGGVLALLAGGELCEQGGVAEGVRAGFRFGGLGGGLGCGCGCGCCEEFLAVGDGPCVALPEGLAFDGLVADGAGELAGAGVLRVRVVDAPGGALLAEEGAGVGHCEGGEGDG